MKLMKVLNCRITLNQLVSKRQNSQQQFWQLESNEDLVKSSIEKKKKMRTQIIEMHANELVR